MNVIGLLIFIIVLIFLIRFTITILGHLFQVFGWLSTDITNIVAKALDIKMAAPRLRERKPFPIEEPEDDELAEIIPRRRALLAETEAAPETDVPPPVEEEEEELTLLLLALYAVVFAFSAITSFILSLMLAPRHIARALRMPFPTRSTVWYTGIFLCVLPIVIFSRVPDIYGYQPTINAVYWGLLSYPCFLFLIYFLRAAVSVDLETVFQRPATETDNDAPAVLKYRHLIYGISIFIVSILMLYKLALPGLVLMCFMYSALYFLAFRKQGNPEFTFRKFIASWLAFGVFLILGIAAVMYSSSAKTVAGFALPIVILITLVFVHTLWVMSRKYQIVGGVKEIPLVEVSSWMNQFISPLIKLAIAAPMFYFLILFFSIQTTLFCVFAALVTLIMILRARLSGRIPVYVPGGLFTGYVILVWIAICFVQTFNRIPPADNTCSVIGDTDSLRSVYTMSDYKKNDFLSGTLPYDTALDAGVNSLFVTFKNLSGYGAVLRVNADTGEQESHIITDNDKFPGEMLYPERLCMNREEKLLYSTTKSNRNFQLLVMDYSDGLELSDRLYFGSNETTNCQVDSRNGMIYTIFLGPPDNHFRIIEPGVEGEPQTLKFGKLGYADYFLLDKERERLVVPSLDPANRFAVYNVKGLDSRDYSVVKKKIPQEFTILGGMKVASPVPTLGIAGDRINNRIYFSCPFMRLVFEVDAETFKLQRKIRTGKFPREIAVNEKHGLLLVANYGDGDVHVFKLDTLERIDKLKVGKLVRSVTVDDETGRTFIVAACGVFEYIPPVK